ncbi:hypothetical protein BT93_L3687 [Corymbia citriodora subsp. variegata]|uniref:Uncharacterized protein n=1 Tax=Corymbia citriodora subsp. variegata TaxID=360336 RepID=A0A8T0CJ46_CORYI|nr:hypothetical protein BT93_L3687 [Corymbia citriodora subsp. variegata]
MLRIATCFGLDICRSTRTKVVHQHLPSRMTRGSAQRHTEPIQVRAQRTK